MHCVRIHYYPQGWTRMHRHIHKYNNKKSAYLLVHDTVVQLFICHISNVCVPVHMCIDVCRFEIWAYSKNTYISVSQTWPNNIIMSPNFWKPTKLSHLVFWQIPISNIETTMVFILDCRHARYTYHRTGTIF